MEEYKSRMLKSPDAQDLELLPELSPELSKHVVTPLRELQIGLRGSLLSPTFDLRGPVCLVGRGRKKLTTMEFSKSTKFDTETYPRGSSKSPSPRSFLHLIQANYSKFSVQPIEPCTCVSKNGHGVTRIPRSKYTVAF